MVKELNALGHGKCTPVMVDTQKFSDVDKLVDEIPSGNEALHVLVNDAGAASGDQFYCLGPHLD